MGEVPATPPLRKTLCRIHMATILQFTARASWLGIPPPIQNTSWTFANSILPSQHPATTNPSPLSLSRAILPRSVICATSADDSAEASTEPRSPQSRTTSPTPPSLRPSSSTATRDRVQRPAGKRGKSSGKNPAPAELPKRLWRESWVPGWGWDGSYSIDMGILESALSAEGLPRQKVALQAVPEGERGLVARQAIGKGESLLYVPESALIFVDTVSLRCLLGGGVLYSLYCIVLVATYLYCIVDTGYEKVW